jgi:hypothetical protein
MKKFLILPVLFSALFFGGCSGYYSQNQVNGLIQQESAAKQVEIDNLKQQASDLQNKINELAQKASTTAVQSVPIPVATTTNTVNDPATKGWLTFASGDLNYQLKYPKDFFQSSPKAVKFSCDVNKFATECPYFDKDYNGNPLGTIDSETRYHNLKMESKEINGQKFCTEKWGEAAAGSLFTTYYYLNVNGSQCDALMYVVQTSDGCDMVAKSNDVNDPNRLKCENNINVVIPQTLSKIESTFSFK